MDGVELEKNLERNQCQKIYTKDVIVLALKYVDENSSQSSDKKIAILKNMSTFLKRRTLKSMKDNPLKRGTNRASSIFYNVQTRRLITRYLMSQNGRLDPDTVIRPSS